MVDLQLKKFDWDNVNLVPKTMELLTDTELTQYYIKSWSLDYNDPGKMQVQTLCMCIANFVICRFTIKWIKNGDSVQTSLDQ